MGIASYHFVDQKRLHWYFGKREDLDKIAALFAKIISIFRERNIIISGNQNYISRPS